MIGDFFGGIGACSSGPIFIGRSVFHSAGSTLGANDFHLINSGNPTTFQGGAGGANAVAFIGPANSLTGFGRPGQSFVAVPTPDTVTVTDQAAPPNEFANLQVYDIFTSPATDICIPNPGTSAVGRVKASENLSPLPRDRVYVNYSYFDNVPFQPGGVGVNRFVPGVEKTFFGGVTSIEVRAPFASTLTSDLISGAGLNDDSQFEWGNLSLISKTLLYRNERWAFSGGMQITVPTADDITVATATGTQLVYVENQSVHLMPFVGALFTPNDRFFAQGYIQVDTNVNNNPVAIRDPFTGVLTNAGGLDDTDFLYMDLALGYWMYRSQCNCARVTGVAPIFEAHWNSSLENSQSVEQNGFRVGDFAGGMDLVNLVMGVVVECGGNTTLTTAFATPVAGGADQDFDGELRVIFNRRFGPQSRASRAQF